jgi:hypothetical protein
MDLALLNIFAVLGFFSFIIALGLYVYTSFAFMKLGKRAKVNTPELAWIPGFGPLIVAFRSAKMHWWPWLLLIAFLIPFLNFVAMVIFAVYAFMWLWKLFESVNRPGWWPLLSLIPAIGTLVFLVLSGIAAWGDIPKKTTSKKKK